MLSSVGTQAISDLIDLGLSKEVLEIFFNHFGVNDSQDHTDAPDLELQNVLGGKTEDFMSLVVNYIATVPNPRSLKSAQIFLKSQVLESAELSPDEQYQAQLHLVEKEDFLNFPDQLVLSLWYEMGLMAAELLIKQKYTQDDLAAIKQSPDDVELLSSISPDGISQGKKDLHVDEWLEFIGWKPEVADRPVSNGQGLELTREDVRTKIKKLGLFDDTDSSEQINQARLTELEEMVYRGFTAGQYLIRTVSRSIMKMARRYCQVNPYVNFYELVQEGHLSLATSLDKYEFWQGTKFITYVTRGARNLVMQAAAGWLPLAKLSVREIGDLQRLHRCEEELTQRLQKVPNIDELAQELGWESEKVINLQFISQPSTKFNNPIGDDDSQNREEVTEDPDADNPEIIEINDWQQTIERIVALAGFTQIEREVWDLYQQLIQDDCEQDQVMGTIAFMRGCSYENIRSIRKGIIKKVFRNPELEAELRALGFQRSKFGHEKTSHSDLMKQVEQLLFDRNQ